MEAANINFMKWALNIELEERSTRKVEIPRKISNLEITLLS